MDEKEFPVIKLKEKFAEEILAEHCFRGDTTVVVRKERIKEILSFLKNDEQLRFNFLMDLTCVDYLGKKSERFEIVYHLYSLTNNWRIRIKVPVSEEDPTIDSVTDIWIGANWFEREVYDMFGIVFKGHPDLRRILLYPEFVGHPLRKDYPVRKRQPLVGPSDWKE
uniref:NADH dehydrogenase I subunit C n=1 Tax=uncultured prokaryote TaxID=198431 RepID=H5SP87_9ZZZZ|nr:NADH dehydrogenase I subunit C [uncultured prokaryote]